MMPEDIIFDKYAWVPCALYYIVSFVIFLGLMLGKFFVNRNKSRLLYIFYTLFVFVVAGIQFCLAVHGTSFLQGFFHIDYDIDSSYPIRFGAFAFGLLFFAATPSNRHYKAI